MVTLPGRIRGPVRRPRQIVEADRALSRLNCEGGKQIATISLLRPDDGALLLTFAVAPHSFGACYPPGGVRVCGPISITIEGDATVTPRAYAPSDVKS